MYTPNTKTRVMQYIQEIGETTYNRVQYLGMDKKQIHHKNLYPILKDLEKEGKVEIKEYVVNGRTSRIIKWK